MPLQDFQWSLAGVVFGPGTVIHLSNVTGLGLGSKRAKVFANPGADGRAWGREYRDGPTLTFEGEIRCDGDPAAAWATLVALRTAFDGTTRTDARSTQSLNAKMPGRAEVAIPGRPDKFDPSLTRLGIGRITFSATFDAASSLVI